MKNFLNELKINVYFICDWDNIKEFGIISGNELKEFKDNYEEEILKEINIKINNKNSLDSLSDTATFFA